MRPPIITVLAGLLHKATKAVARDIGEIANLQNAGSGSSGFLGASLKRLAHNLVDELVKTYPDHGILMPQGLIKPAQNAKQSMWILDVLSGQENFSRGLAHVAVSLALRETSGLGLGMIFDPARQELFWAMRGMGAFLNQTRLRVSHPKQPLKTLLGISAVSRECVLPGPLSTLLGQHMGSLRVWGAPALDMAYVAAGRLDGCYLAPLPFCCLAAGIVLMKEAGGMVLRPGCSLTDEGNSALLAGSEALFTWMRGFWPDMPPARPATASFQASPSQEHTQGFDRRAPGPYASARSVPAFPAPAFSPPSLSTLERSGPVPFGDQSYAGGLYPPAGAIEKSGGEGLGGHQPSKKNFDQGLDLPPVRKKKPPMVEEKIPEVNFDNLPLTSTPLDAPVLVDHPTPPQGPAVFENPADPKKSVPGVDNAAAHVFPSQFTKLEPQNPYAPIDAPESASSEPQLPSPCQDDGGSSEVHLIQDPSRSPSLTGLYLSQGHAAKVPPTQMHPIQIHSMEIPPTTVDSTEGRDPILDIQESKEASPGVRPLIDPLTEPVTSPASHPQEPASSSQEAAPTLDVPPAQTRPVQSLPAQIPPVWTSFQPKFGP